MTSEQRLRAELADLKLSAQLRLDRLVDANDQLEEERANSKRLQEALAAAEARIAETRKKALEEAAKVVGKHNKTGREWVPGSLWDSITLEAVSRIRSLPADEAQP